MRAEVTALPGLRYSTVSSVALFSVLSAVVLYGPPFAKTA
jgi:hypothetical protein